MKSCLSKIYECTMVPVTWYAPIFDINKRKSVQVPLETATEGVVVIYADIREAFPRS